MDATANPPSVYTYPEYLAFLTKILTEPAEDVHRLVLADWLEEHGERERAELIRVQVELAHSHPHNRRGRAYCLRLREAELFAPYQNRLRWFGRPSEVAVDPDAVGWPVTRGFVSAVTCTAQDWLAHADALCWHPSQTVECRECKGWMGRGPKRGAGGAAQPPWCNACKTDTGRIPRPVPPTAQPIERVVLTGEVTGRIIEQVCARLSTAPNPDSPYPDATRGVLWASGLPCDRYSDTVLAVFGRAWKGITFTPPTT